MGDKFIPNSFQVPNAYVDRVMPYLTGEEWKVLTYAARRIFGFQKREDRIAVSQFENGIHSREGVQLDSGTGLARATILKALAELTRFNILILLEKGDSKANANKYALQLDDDLVKWELLEQRKASQANTGGKRAARARENIKKDTPIYGGSEEPTPTPEPVYVIDRLTTGLSDEPQPVYGIDHNRSMGQTDNNQGKPVENQDKDLSLRDPEKSEEAPQEKTPREPTPHYLIAQALAEVTGMPLEKNPRVLREAKLYEPGDDQKIRAGYAKGRTPWYVNDWRGKKNQPPTLAQIRETWGLYAPAQVVDTMEQMKRDQAEMREIIRQAKARKEAATNGTYQSAA